MHNCVKLYSNSFYSFDSQEYVLQISQLCEKKKLLKAIVTQPALAVLIKLFTKICATFFLSYALISFDQLQYSQYITVGAIAQCVDYCKHDVKW